MGLKHVTLAVVADNLAHGYEIHRHVAQAFPTSRQCDSSRIYGILAGLEREGWVLPSLEDAGRGRVRKRYRLTRAGSRELTRWLERPRPGSGLLRRSLLVRLALAHDPVGPGEAARRAAGWAQALGRWVRRREVQLRPSPGETRMARLVRLRELAHLDAELRTLRAVVGSGHGPELS